MLKIKRKILKKMIKETIEFTEDRVTISADFSIRKKINISDFQSNGEFGFAINGEMMKSSGISKEDFAFFKILTLYEDSYQDLFNSDSLEPFHILISGSVELVMFKENYKIAKLEINHVEIAGGGMRIEHALYSGRYSILDMLSDKEIALLNPIKEFHHILSPYLKYGGIATNQTQTQKCTDRFHEELYKILVNHEILKLLIRNKEFEFSQVDFALHIIKNLQPTFFYSQLGWITNIEELDDLLISLGFRADHGGNYRSVTTATYEDEKSHLGFVFGFDHMRPLGHEKKDVKGNVLKDANGRVIRERSVGTALIQNAYAMNEEELSDDNVRAAIQIIVEIGRFYDMGM